MDWLDIGCVLVVNQNISWTCTRFHLKNKISIIALGKVNVDVSNVVVEANSIILIGELNLDISDLFNDPDDKIDHLIEGGILRLDLLLSKLRMSVYLIMQQHIKSSEIYSFSWVWHCVR